MIRLVTAAAFALALAAAPAAALSLRPDVTVGEDVVRLGDIFSGGGDKADVALFRAPAPGTDGIVGTERLRQAVRRLGLAWAPPYGLNQIKVTREAVTQKGTVALATIARRLALAIADTLPGARTVEDLAVTLAPDAGPVHLKGEGAHELDIVRLDIDPGRGSFEAAIEVTEPAGSSTHRFSGEYEEYVDVPILAADVRRGETIGPEHLATIRTGRGEAALAAAMDDIVGKAARRYLRAGATLRLGDVEDPKVVERGQLVTVTFERPGMMITTQGRALEAAAAGGTVPVRNLSSNRVIHAVATGPGRVSVGIIGPTHLAMN